MSLSRHRNPLELEDKLVRAAMIGLYMLGSVVIAYWIGKGEQRLLIIIGLVFAACLTTIGLRHRAWMLILIGWSIAGNTAVFSLPFSIRDITVMLAGCSYLAFRVLTPRGMRYGWHPLDVILFLNALYLIFTLFHNPVGFHVFGSETIGARPYVNFSIAFVAYWVIVRLPDSVRSVSWAPFLLLSGVAYVTVLYVIAYFIPSVVTHLTVLYAMTDVGAYFSTGAAEAVIARFPHLGDFGLALLLVLVSCYHPRSFFRLTRMRFYLMVLSMVCILASGFRNMILWAIVAWTLSCIFNRSWRELLLTAGLSVLLLGALAFAQGRLFNLPLPAQRALSFLPGSWSEVVVADAQGSSEGRYKWWRDIVRYNLIDDWWFGDGFGARLEDIEGAARHGSYEDFVLLTGAYHSGPLTAIRYVGVVGMVLLYALMIMAAYYSVLYVKLCWGTPLQPLAIFIAIQSIWTPISYTLVFGGYDAQFPNTLLMAGLLRLLIRMQHEIRAETPQSTLVHTPLPSHVAANAT